MSDKLQINLTWNDQALPVIWYPVTDIPPSSWHLVVVGGEVHEALYFANADNIADLLISGGADHPLINGRWCIANDTAHRMVMRKGARVTAWAEMPSAPAMTVEVKP